MSHSWPRKLLSRWFKQTPSRDAVSNKSRRVRLRVEGLEDRITPAVRVWDGGAGGGDVNWATAGNWVGDIAPLAGDDLVFANLGAGASVNNLAAGTRVNTILFTAGGHSVTGNAIELYGGLTANNVAGTTSFGLN